MVFTKLFASHVGGKGMILLKTSHVLSISENHIPNLIPLKGNHSDATNMQTMFMKQFDHNIP